MLVRRLRLEQKAQHFSFLREAYGGTPAPKFPERWLWEFERNPFLPTEELPVWVALDGDRIIGQLPLLFSRYKVGDATEKLGSMVDYVVLPEARGTGVGHALVDALQAENKSLVSCWVAEAAKKIFVRHGIETHPQLTCFRKVVARTNHSTSHERLSRSHRVRIVETATFGREADEIWNAGKNDFANICMRDAQYLNWKFCSQPHLSYRRFVAYQDQKPIGYVVLRLENIDSTWRWRGRGGELRPGCDRVGVLADLFVPQANQDLLTILADYAIAQLSTAGAQQIVAASSVGSYQRCYIDLGFEATTTWPFYCWREPECSQEQPLSAAVDWFLSKSDSDFDQHGYAWCFDVPF
jgi:GNAT superfamily N-acetyltransferase